jgi:hypothetical protein
MRMSIGIVVAGVMLAALATEASGQVQCCSERFEDCSDRAQAQQSFCRSDCAIERGQGLAQCDSLAECFAVVLRYLICRGACDRRLLADQRACLVEYRECLILRRCVNTPTATRTPTRTATPTPDGREATPTHTVPMPPPPPR